MQNPIHNLKVRKIGGKILYGLSFFDHVSASKKTKLINTSGKKILPHHSVCIYVTYDENVPSAASIELIKAVTQLDFNVIHINNINKKRCPESSSLYPTIQRNNFGYDLGAVRDGLQLLTKLPSELLIINSSVLYFPGGLMSIVEKARTSRLDVVGVTESLQTRDHIQSYFFYSKTDVGIRTLISEYSRMRNWRTKRAAVGFGELRMMSNMKSRNIQVGVLIPYLDLTAAALQNPNLVDRNVLNDLKMGRKLNPTQHLWKVLFYFGIPFIKKTLLHDNPAHLKNTPKDFNEASEVFKSVSKNQESTF